MHRDDVEGRTLLDAYRSVHTPDDAATRAAMQRMRTRIERGEAPDVDAPRGSVRRIAIAALAIAALVVIAIGLQASGVLAQRLGDDADDPQAAYQGAAQDETTVQPAVDGAPSPTIQRDRDRDVVPSIEPSEEATSEPPPTPIGAPTERTRPRPRAPKPAPDDASLHAEMVLLSAAQSALSAGNPSRALEQLDRHAARFPGSLLAEEREVARIQALCDLGRKDAAAAALRAFKRRHPGSPLTGRATKACERAGESAP